MNTTDKILFRLKISRPLLWIPQIFLFLLGYLLAQKTFNLEFFYLLLIFTFPINYIAYGINDYFDYETDKNNKRKNSIEGAIINPNRHKYILYEIIILTFIIAILTFLVTNIITGTLITLLLISSYLYSTPPIKTKNIPLIDSISCGIGYFLFLLIGYSSNTDLIPDKTITSTILLFLIALHSYTTVLDYKPDKKAKIKTIATYFGKRFAIIFSVIILLIATLINSFNILLKSIFCITIFTTFLTIFKPTNKILKINIIFFLCLFMIYSIYYIFTKLI